MSCIEYTPRKFSAASKKLIAECNRIIDDYTAQGYTLTLRQLYYRLVASGYIPNTIQSYKNVGSVINDARLAGEVDWEAIEDRTRQLSDLSHWHHPHEVILSAAYSYRLDKWRDQQYRPEVWVEKEALAGVVERVAMRWDVPYLSCRGYMSQSEMHEAGLRFSTHLQRSQVPVVIHLGDHDPSGMDMTRDIRERLELFVGYHAGTDVEVKRIALNMDQVESYDPPPNPAKITDSRATGYIARFGELSWELDALEPAVLDDLISRAIESFCDTDKYQRLEDQESKEREALRAAADHWDEVASTLEKIEGASDE